MKTLLTLFLFSVFAQGQVTTKVLKQGSSYNWKIELMQDGKNEATYFYFTCAESKNSNGLLYIAIPTRSELEDLVYYLRLFANSPNANLDVRTDRFCIERYVDIPQLVLSDLQPLNGFVKLSKTSALSLATEISNNLALMK